MRYYEAVSEVAFRTTASGQRAFFPFGALGRGRVLPDELAERGVRRVMKFFYGFTVGVMTLLLLCRLDWLSICGVMAGVILAYYAALYAKVRALPFADERLGWGEAYRTMARNMGRWRLLGACLMCAVFAGLAVLVVVAKDGGPFEIWQVLAGAALMLFLAIFYGWLAWLATQEG